MQGLLIPKFWANKDAESGRRLHINLRRIWKLTVLLIAVVTITPLILSTIIGYNVTQHAIESEILLRTSRLVSNTRRTITFFLSERKSALNFISRNNSYKKMQNPSRLKEILYNLKLEFGGFVDLGIIDASGMQKRYVGPYKLEGKNYIDQEWFQKISVHGGAFISDVFMGFRNVPHIIITIKKDLPDGSFYLLRATIDTGRFNNMLSEPESSGLGDAFVINNKGILQTPSRQYGHVLEKITLPIPDYSERTQVFEGRDPDRRTLIIGYAYIAQTPFILMIVKRKNELMESWHRTRLELIGFLIFSIIIILIVILGVSTYLVEKIHVADQQRVLTLHEAEYSNKMASIGRLAASVAHEINNPLAIINEKAGLIKDLFVFNKQHVEDQKLIGLVDSVIYSVDRCATITRRLLNFARRTESKIVSLNLKEVITEVLGFQGKEAEYKSIEVSVDVPDEIPELESDRGCLQEIFLNLFNNAFAAMDNGGKLEIIVRQPDQNHVSVNVIDEGCGIPQENLKRVFEPHFSTKTKSGGTGLGLSITYGLVRQIGGKISVQSEIGKGTNFSIILPLSFVKRSEKDENTVS